jgi:hypothetical protein
MQAWVGRLLQKKRNTAMLAVSAPLALACFDGGHLSALPVSPGDRGPRTEEQQAIESRPVCIGSSVSSAGTLSDVLYYRAVRLPDGKLAVGYFAFWSEERPWGNNWLTWSVLPALSVDLVYSRALLVAPGLQRALYGLGDVEGVSIVYSKGDDGTLRPEEAWADDDTEHAALIPRERMFALDAARPTFYTDIWSHQLAGSGAGSRKDLAYVRCYEGSTIRPLPDAVARAFRVEGRAGPAHVERTAGATRIDSEGAEMALSQGKN